MLILEIWFSSLQMSSANRRETLAGAAAGAAVVALPLRAHAKSVWPSNKAPIITIFDARGCNEHKNREYTGPKAGNNNDDMCVKVQFERIQADEGTAFQILKESLSELKK